MENEYNLSENIGPWQLLMHLTKKKKIINYWLVFSPHHYTYTKNIEMIIGSVYDTNYNDSIDYRLSTATILECIFLLKNEKNQYSLIRIVRQLILFPSCIYILHILRCLWTAKSLQFRPWIVRAYLDSNGKQNY